MNSPSQEPLYNIGVVTRLTGIPVTTLHAWERRYGFPNTARTAGGHRLYSERDIARLRWVKAQIDSGMQARQAVAGALRLESDGTAGLSASPEAASPLPVPSAAIPALSETLLQALAEHDLPRADQVLGDLLAVHSPDEITLGVIGPALNALGEAWAVGRISVATEHLASNYLRHRLLMWMVTGPRPRPVQPVVLACAPGEWHEGSLLMLAVMLRRQGWPAVYLGQNVPFGDLASFVRQIDPPVVVLVAMLEEAARALAEWPRWITQDGGRPVVAYGGRAFVIRPELPQLVPGTYLGSDLQDGWQKLIGLLG